MRCKGDNQHPKGHNQVQKPTSTGQEQTVLHKGKNVSGTTNKSNW